MEVVKDKMTSQYTEYINYLRDVKKSSDNTLQAYVRDLKKFFDYASVAKIDDFSSLTVDEVADYKQYLGNLGLSPASVSRSLSALRSLFQFLISN